MGAVAACGAPAARQERVVEAPRRAVATALPTPPERLNQIELDRLRESVGTPALAAATQAQSGPVVAWVSGVRRRGGPDQVTLEDRWHLGSITKSMTATLVARCVDAGWIDWRDTVESALGKVLPEMRAEYRDANFLHLLSHRAGLQTDVIELGVIGLPLREDDARESRRVIARHALRQDPAGEKETAFVYSHSGYVIAAAMLEARLGAPWEELMRQHVFEPLGMSSAGFGPPGLHDEGGQPVGHASWFTQSITPHDPGEDIADIPTGWGPAGSVHTSLPDLIAYLNAHRDKPDFLREETWATLHTPPFGGEYALGWHMRNGGLWHNGTNSMWYAEALIDPVRKKSAAAVCNDGRLEAVTPIVHAALMSAVRLDDVTVEHVQAAQTTG
ncbi:MAG TPA: serine hydrolase domain-containing protein [Verrucomicrobiae bacterium]|nr:serine hydrolase domain-containing protein [Verrucomicrobiae bacterium]